MTAGGGFWWGVINMSGLVLQTTEMEKKEERMHKKLPLVEVNKEKGIDTLEA